MVAVKKKMCYIGSMNKDVVYIEPEEDITDIISKVKGSKSKIVALVPPKKAGVFRSIVNIKLIAKAGTNAEKTVVLVTTDSSIIKLAAATKMPVTKDLKSAPKVPEIDEDFEDETEEVVDVDDEAEEEPDEPEKSEEEEEPSEKKAETKEEKVGSSADEEEKKDDDEEDDEYDDDSDDDKHKEDDEPKNDRKKDKKSAGKLANSKNVVLRWIGTHKKLSAGIGAGVVLLIIFMVWAFGIAPAVTVTLKLETVKGNFSENVSFVDKLTDENVTEGKFYIEEKKLENKAEVEFEATGKKNVGDKATGTIKVTHYFPLNEENGGKVSIPNGTTFTNSGLSYTVTSGATISWDGDLKAIDKDCENNATAGWRQRGCAVSANVTVTANEPGTKYNIAGTSAGWSSSVGGLDVISNNAMTGGSDKEATVVQQSDIDKAINEMATENESVNKEKLLETLSEGQFAIDSSYKQTAADPVSTPEIGKEVEDGKKAKLTVTTTSTIFVMDETKLKEFITEKAKLEKGYKIYEMDNPFIENFVKTDTGYIGKLKTSYKAGSTITENEVVDTVKGKGIGSAKRDLTDNFDGIKTITIDTSVPWVTSVPGNTEKITVIINVEE